MAVHTLTTPLGVNASGLPAFRLLPGAAARSPGLLGTPPELPPEPLLAQARALHARRALEDAIHHGAALMAALGVSPVPVGSTSAPSRVIAIAEAIDLLDRLDASGEDLEDDEPEDDSEQLEDGADAEPSLARPEGHQFEAGGDLDLELPIAAFGPGLYLIAGGLHG